MNKIVFLLSWLAASILLPSQLLSQCICSFIAQVEQDPADPCCLQISICKESANCDPDLVFNKLKIITNLSPSTTLPIASIIPAAGITYTTSGLYEATFTSATPFPDCAPGIPLMLIATVCLDPVMAVQPVVELILIDENPGSAGECTLNQYEFPNLCSSQGCTTDFQWSALPGNCGFVSFTSQPMGTAPFTYAWDFNCDGFIESTAANPGWNFFPCGSIEDVCLTVTDADGNTCTHEEEVILPPDFFEPFFDCQNKIVNTDPGKCTATVLPPFAFDDCDPSPQVTCSPALPASLPKGVTTINCQAFDFCGNSTQCTYTVTVVDAEKPVIQCPPNVTVSVPGCSNGAVVTYPPPVATDNCPGVSYTCSIPSGSFFPCGTTTVTCTAFDANLPSLASNPCTFQVNVQGCQNCVSLASTTASCGAVDDTYNFTIVVNNLTTVPGNLAAVTSATSGFTLGTITSSGSQITVNGILAVAPGKPPASLSVSLQFSFPCQFGVIGCTLNASVQTPCCEQLTLSDQTFCSEENYVDLPLLPLDCDGLNDCGAQVRWYMKNGPCSSGSPWIAVDASTDCNLPLTVVPDYWNNTLCVRAEVSFAGGPCPQLTTNEATITFCDPVGGSVSPASQSHCSASLPGTFPLAYSPSGTDCNPQVVWHCLNGSTGQWQQVGMGNNYVAAGLSYGDPNAASTNDCFTDYSYRATATNLCGSKAFFASIRIYNDNAPEGTLTLSYPGFPMPFCPGQDVVVCYEPACVEPDPEKWYWHSKPDGGTYSPVPGSGDINPKHYTNEIWEDTWFQVTKNNGSCQEDRVEILVDVLEETTVDNFTAVEFPACLHQGVDLCLEFTTECSQVTIAWYHDGNLVGTSTSGASPACFNYVNGSLSGNYQGNYYAVVEDCCGRRMPSTVVVIAPPCDLVILAPCFRCKDETIHLQGVVVNAPDGVPITYQWYADFCGGGSIGGATSADLFIAQAGNFTLEANVGGCIKTASVNVMQCEIGTSILCAALSADVQAGFTATQDAGTTVTFKPVQLDDLCDAVEWNWGDGSPNLFSSGNAAVAHTFPSWGNYQVCMIVDREASDGSVCSETFCMPIAASATSEKGGQQLVRVFPNPTSGDVQLVFSQITGNRTTVEILDALGIVHRSQPLPPGKPEHSLSLAGMPSGVYFIKILENGEPVWVEKIVKQ